MVFDTLIKSIYNLVATPEPLRTPFYEYLCRQFQRNTALKVVTVFQQMNLPMPQDGDEFMEGTEGALIFLNKYGVVIRIESKDTRRSFVLSDRVNDSPWIIQPLASINAGQAILEICPGCNLEADPKNVLSLYNLLRGQGIDYFDHKLANNGRLPVATPSFPDGVPVVIDRLAVSRLTLSVGFVREALDTAAREAAEAQEKLYGPLRQAFDAAWPNAEKMKKFWTLCERYAGQGKLVAGWKEFETDKQYSKQQDAAMTAKQYEARLG